MTITIDEQTAFERLLQSPRLKFYSRDIERVLDKEATRRQQFYEQMTEGEKTEFINGEVIVHSPVKKRHSSASGKLFTLLDAYVAANDLGFVGHEKILITLTRNDYEPDICYFRREVAERFTEDQMKFPEPDFAVEVLSPSTEEYDRDTKFLDYAAHDIAEYWIIDPVAKTVEQYQLRAERYELLLKSGAGEIQSIVLPDFVIPVRAIFDEALQVQTLRALLATG